MTLIAVRPANQFRLFTTQHPGARLSQRVLKQNYQTDYLLKHFLNSAYFDLKKCQETGGADKLSRKRNLILTIDGVHLNSAGAMLYKQAIEIQINRGGCY